MTGMGCNNENWSPHPESHESSKPVKETPEDMKGFNMTELAQWVNGDINQIVKKVLHHVVHVTCSRHLN